MKRRDFIAFVFGAAVARPLSGYAQQSAAMRHIAVLMPYADDPMLATADETIE